MERKEAIERLKQLRLDYTEFWEEIKNETTEALDMAINSLKTDEAYQLEYEDRDCVEVIRCKNCKWWKDSDGAYRRGCNAESKCPISHIEVYEGNGYCFLGERKEQTDGNDY